MNFSTIFREPFETTMTITTIKSGICPFNPDAINKVKVSIDI